MLQNSFRKLRHPPSSSAEQKAVRRHAHFHDDVFFGDSSYSVGIQLADLCSYFIARRLQGEEEINPFYELIEPHIAYGQFYPDEETFTTPRPVLTNFRALLELGANERKRISEVRQDDGQTIEGSAPRDTSEVAIGE